MFKEKILAFKFRLKQTCNSLLFQFRDLATFFQLRKEEQRESSLLYQYRQFAGGLRFLLGCVPALIALSFVVFVTVKIFGSEEAIKGRYRAGMTSALTAGNNKLARAYGERLMLSSGTITLADRMDWVTCLLQNDERILALEHLNQLAPNDRPGHPPAHRLKAILLTQRFEATGQRDLLDSLFFQLSHASDQGSYPICLGFSTYFTAIRQPEKVIPYLKSAASVDPMLYSKLASIYAEINDQAAYRATLLKAATELSKALADNPENLSTRIEYARVLVVLNRHDEALSVLKEGHDLEPSPQLNRSIAVFYMMLFDQANDANFRIDLVKAALDFDPGYVQPYAKLLTQFEQLDGEDPELGDQIVSLIESQANRPEAPAIALFSLSNLAHIVGDQNQYRINLEKTLQRDPQFSIAANNLAWLLAHDKEHLNMERAVALAEDLVKKHPDNPEFHDTYGTILMRLGKFELALDELEKVMNQVANKPAVHSKLAKIYDHLGKPGLADMHREKSVEYSTEKAR